MVFQANLYSQEAGDPCDDAPPVVFLFQFDLRGVDSGPREGQRCVDPTGETIPIEAGTSPSVYHKEYYSGVLKVDATGSIGNGTASVSVQTTLDFVNRSMAQSGCAVWAGVDGSISAYVRGEPGTRYYFRRTFAIQSVATTQEDGGYTTAEAHAGIDGTTAARSCPCGCQPDQCGTADKSYDQEFEGSTTSPTVEYNGHTYSSASGGGAHCTVLTVGTSADIQPPPPYTAHAEASVEFTVTAYPLGEDPVARITAPASVDSCDEPVQLDGTGSTPQDDCLAYKWSIFSAPDGSKAQLDDPAAQKPKLKTDKPGVYTVQLVVSLNGEDSQVDTVMITAPCCPFFGSLPDCATPGRQLVVCVYCLQPGKPYEIAVISSPGPLSTYTGVADADGIFCALVTIPNVEPFPQDVSIVLAGTILKTTLRVGNPKITGYVTVCGGASMVSRRAVFKNATGSVVAYAPAADDGYFYLCNLIPGQYQVYGESSVLNAGHFENSTPITFVVTQEGNVGPEPPYDVEGLHMDVGQKYFNDNTSLKLYQGTFGEVFAVGLEVGEVVHAVDTIREILKAAAVATKLAFFAEFIASVGITYAAGKVFEAIATDRMEWNIVVTKATYDCETGEYEPVGGKLFVRINDFTWEKDLGESISIFGNSPITLIASDIVGNRIGYDVVAGLEVNEFGPGARYSGSGSHPQVIDIPLGLDLSVVVDGTGEGSYQLVVQHKRDNDVLDEVHAIGTTGIGKSELYNVALAFEQAGGSAVLQGLAGPYPGVRFIRGNANQDSKVDISDSINTLGLLFSGTGDIPCLAAADSNDDSRVDISDAIFTLGFLFLGTAPPPPPGPDTCGADPTPDDLPECSYDRVNC